MWSSGCALTLRSVFSFQLPTSHRVDLSNQFQDSFCEEQRSGETFHKKKKKKKTKRVKFWHLSGSTLGAWRSCSISCLPLHGREETANALLWGVKFVRARSKAAGWLRRRRVTHFDQVWITALQKHKKPGLFSEESVVCSVGRLGGRIRRRSLEKMSLNESGAQLILLSALNPLNPSLEFNILAPRNWLNSTVHARDVDGFLRVLNLHPSLDILHRE